MRSTGAAVLLTLASACHGCQSTGGHPAPPPGQAVASLTVTSAAFRENGPIPVDYTCDGADHSPPLTWSAAPSATKSIALEVDDPDAPGGDFVHWVAFNLPASMVQLPESVDVAALGGVDGSNGFGHPGYGGPCPPRHEVHRYNFRVLAVDAAIVAKPGASRSDVDAALNGHVLAEGNLVGLFEH